MYPPPLCIQALRERGVTVHFEGVGSKHRKRAPPKGGSKRAGVRSVTVRRLPSLVTGFGPMPPVYVDGSAADSRSGVGVWYGKGHRCALYRTSRNQPKQTCIRHRALATDSGFVRFVSSGQLKFAAMSALRQRALSGGLSSIEGAV